MPWAKIAGRRRKVPPEVWAILIMVAAFAACMALLAAGMWSEP